MSLFAGAAEAAKPNVLFIIADDLRPSLSCYGVTEVESPNIDRLAARGMRFDRAYCQYSMCNPSRSSLLSGLRPDTTGILDNKTPLREKLPGVVTLPQLFRQNGYFTASIGKVFHAGLDANGRRTFHEDPKSWDECRSYKATPRGQTGVGRDLSQGKAAWCNWLAAEGTDQDQPDGQIAADAVRLIEKHRGEPFFLAVGFQKPHDPFHAPKQYFEPYPLDEISLAQLPPDRTPEVAPALAKGNLAIFNAFDDQDRREFKRAYYAGTSFTDAQIGKLLDTLDRYDLWKNTIVVFFGDHGYHLGEHGWWNKVTLFELSARPPLIVWAPDADGMGSSTAGIVEFIDLYPTLTESAGLTPPPGLEGKSFGALLDNPARAGKQAAYTQVDRGAFMGYTVRTDRWRYTEWDAGKQGVELYDMTIDPENYHNLAGKPVLAEAESELRQLLHRPRK